MRFKHGRAFLFVLALALILPGMLTAQAGNQFPAISTERIRADLKYLSGEQLQGRGVGTRGEELATDHIAALFKKAGL